MDTGFHRTVLRCLALCVLAGAASGQTTTLPQTSPAAPAVQWGEAKAGLQASLSLEGDAAVGGKWVFHLALRNVGGEPVKLGPAKDVSSWMLVGQSVSDEKKMFYSEKVEVARGLSEWPAELARDKTITFKPIDLSGSAAYPSESARELLTSYLSGRTPDNPPKPVGKLNEVIAPGKGVARMTLLLPRPGEKPLVVNSNPVELTVAPPRLSSLSAEQRKAFVAALLKQFDRDAFGGQAAHGAAVKLGKDIVPDLVKAVAERGRPAYSRMWIATAIADIPDGKAADALIDLLNDTLGGVRQVVAYHGPKQRSDKLDQAILDKAKTLKEDGFTAMALLGFMVHRDRVPEDLLKAGLESDDPKARAAAVRVLGGLASDFNVARLQALSKDKDERVRSAARKILDAMKASTSLEK